MNKKSKKIVSFLTALVLISGGTCFPETSTSIFNVSTNVSAASTYGDLTYEISNGEVKITSCDKSVTEVEIPSEIEGYPVTAIDGAFALCRELTSVTIPNSITSIDYETFSGCYGLTSVTIPNSVTSIGERAFFGCAGLNSVTIPESITNIGYGAFNECSRLTSITVNENNLYYSDIDGIMFNKDKTSLIKYPCDKETTNEAYIIPTSVTSIGDDAFEYCYGLTSVTIPDSVTSIGERAFFGCTGLTSVRIPKSVTYVGFYSLGFPDGKSDNFKIYGYLDSSAESYARHYQFEFIDIESEPIVTTPPPSIVYGDISMDNKIDNVDLVTLCQVLIKEIALDSNQALRADLNNDGAIDVSDAATLKQYILGDKVTLGPKK